MKDNNVIFRISMILIVFFIFSFVHETMAYDENIENNDSTELISEKKIHTDDMEAVAENDEKEIIEDVADNSIDDSESNEENKSEGINLESANEEDELDENSESADGQDEDVDSTEKKEKVEVENEEIIVPVPQDTEKGIVTEQIEALDVLAVRSLKSTAAPTTLNTVAITNNSIVEGEYEISTILDEGKVIEVEDGSDRSGANVRILNKNNAECQRVYIKKEDSEYYTLMFMHSSKYLDVANGSTADKTNVWQCNYNGSDAQIWKIQKNANGYYNIISKLGNKYLTVANGVANNCANIEINSKKSNNSQLFKLEKLEKIIGQKVIEDGIYVIETGVDSKKAIEVVDGTDVSGGNVQIYEKNNADCQRVNIKYSGNGYYEISFVHSKKYLDVANGKTENKTNVWQCSYNGSDAQKWVVKDAGNGYFNIISKLSNSYLTVDNGKKANCTNIEINKSEKGLAQCFKLVKEVAVTGVQSIQDGTYEIITAVDNNKAIEVNSALVNSGANVQIYTRNNAACQRVVVKYIGNGYYNLSFEHSGKYLDVANGKKENKTNVWQCNYNGSDAQKWIIKDAGNGYYNIISKLSNTYLTIDGGKSTDCTNIEINQKKNNNSQLFIFSSIKKEIGTRTIADGLYEIETGVRSSKVLEVDSSSQNSGANVQIYTRNNTVCQKVYVEYVGDGYYNISFAHSDKYLDVANGKKDYKTNVWQCSYNGSDAQKWIIKDAGNGYYNIISKLSNTYLTVEGGKDNDCTNVEIDRYRGDKSQKFKFNITQFMTGTRTIEDGIYEIEVGVDSSKAIEVVSSLHTSGANVQIYSKNDAMCQKVSVKYIGDGYYTLSFIHSGKYLDVANGETCNGANVWQCDYNGSDAQKWIIKDAGNGYYNIISKKSEAYLDVAGGSNYNCTNVQTFQNNGSMSQKFKFKKLKNQMIGIDVSVHQGNIDWEAVKSEGINFAILRCGFGSDMVSQDDGMFARNVAECQRLGIPYGVYLYSYALNVQAAESEAYHVLRLIENTQPELGIWFDMEDADSYKKRHEMPSNETLVDMCVTFCEIMKDRGHRVGNYASLSWFNNQLNSTRLDSYEKWVAQWNDKCTYKKPYTMWQYTSTGIVNGISGCVDMNIYYF